MEEVVRTGLARFEYRHLPRHRQSEFAANAVECAADQDAFWAAHDVYMAGGDRTIYGRAGAVRVAGELGLDTERFGRCVDERTHLPTINADHQIARAAGYRVTPILLVNGRQVLATADAVIAAVRAAAQ